MQVCSLAHLLLVFALSSLPALLLGCIEGFYKLLEPLIVLRSGAQLTEVSSSVVVQPLGVLVDNIRGDFVQECTIVRNHKDCARVSLEVIRKESNGRNVQHVRRFCEMSVGCLWNRETSGTYRRAKANQARRIELVRETNAFSNLRRRSWWRTADALGRNQDQPRYWPRGIRPYQTPFLKAFHEYHLT